LKHRHCFYLSLIIGSLLLLLAACSRNQERATSRADQITALGKSCEELYAQHIAAWDSKQPDKLRQVYTDDIVHFDGEPLYIGIDEVIAMADDMFHFFPDWQMQAGETYISRSGECLGTWVNWGVFGFTQESPGLEFDLFTLQESKISFWRLFYDQKFYNALASYYRIKPDFLSQFASAWSGGGMVELAELYADDAVLEDSLFGVNITGTLAIQEYATNFWARSPGATWSLLTPFGEDRSRNQPDLYPHPAQGGIYAVTVKDKQGAPCEIRLAVILTPDENEIILSQKMYYAADTLLACGWAE
jgi:ketosteroid isomerase-like protein